MTKLYISYTKNLYFQNLKCFSAPLPTSKAVIQSIPMHEFIYWNIRVQSVWSPCTSVKCNNYERYDHARGDFYRYLTWFPRFKVTCTLKVAQRIYFHRVHAVYTWHRGFTDTCSSSQNNMDAWQFTSCVQAPRRPLFLDTICYFIQQPVLAQLCLTVPQKCTKLAQCSD
jgi:hypothetical protein